VGLGSLLPAERVPRSLPALMRAAELGEKLGWPEVERDGVVAGPRDHPEQ
jgi:hypothetical protein